MRDTRKVDPAADAASLLRRLGCLLLFAGLPFAALISRNAGVIVYTIAISLVVAAAVFDGALRPWRESLARALAHPTLVALLVLIGWTLLSLAWTPLPRSGSLPGTGLVLLLGLVGYVCLPDRMRAANLYILPVGVVLAAAVAIGLVLATAWEGDPEERRRVLRCVTALLVLVWPGVAWLRSRGRHGEAVGLAALVAVAAALSPAPSATFVLAFGALAYVVVQLGRRRAATVVGIVLALGFLAVPLVVWAAPLLAAAGGRIAAWASAVEPWREVVAHNPLRLLTGRGLGALRLAGERLWNLPAFGAPVLELWYELGLVAAGAIAAALAFVMRGTAVGFTPLLPSLAGAVATALGIGVVGLDEGESWWFATLCAVALAFVAAERGQFRTRRPRALVFGRAPAA